MSDRWISFDDYQYILNHEGPRDFVFRCIRIGIRHGDKVHVDFEFEYEKMRKARLDKARRLHDTANRVATKLHSGNV